MRRLHGASCALRIGLWSESILCDLFSVSAFFLNFVLFVYYLHAHLAIRSDPWRDTFILYAFQSQPVAHS